MGLKIGGCDSFNTIESRSTRRQARMALIADSWARVTKRRITDPDVYTKRIEVTIQGGYAYSLKGGGDDRMGLGFSIELFKTTKETTDWTLKYLIEISCCESPYGAASIELIERRRFKDVDKNNVSRGSLPNQLVEPTLPP